MLVIVAREVECVVFVEKLERFVADLLIRGEEASDGDFVRSRWMERAFTDQDGFIDEHAQFTWKI